MPPMNPAHSLLPIVLLLCLLAPQSASAAAGPVWPGTTEVAAGVTDEDEDEDEDDWEDDEEDEEPQDDEDAGEDDASTRADRRNYEGDEPGECSDGADNDQDGAFDCDDSDCAGAPTCKDKGTPTDNDRTSRPDAAPDPAPKKSAFAAWRKQRTPLRIGLRFYGYLPNTAVTEHAAFNAGAGLTIPVTIDLFMGLGVRASFITLWNSGDDCVNRNGIGGDPSCPQGHVGGVDYRWREPYLLGEDGTTQIFAGAGRNGDALAGDQFVQHRRPTHVAQFGFSIGINYELTLPHIRFFQIFQPFVGGGLALFWVHTYSDLSADEFVLINNAENDTYDPNNLDPWSRQGPVPCPDLYFGFHVNLARHFRLVVEFGAQAVDIPAAPLEKATSIPPDRDFEAEHLPYTLVQFRMGGGFEFIF